MKDDGQFEPTHAWGGWAAERLSLPLLRVAGTLLKFHHAGSRYTLRKGEEFRQRLARGESLYLMGLGPSGHNSAAALVEVSAERGIRALCNNEEERFSARRHDDHFPVASIQTLLDILGTLGKTPADIFAVLASWDYVQGIATSLRTLIEELPGSLFLSRRAASPHMNPWHFVEALKTPKRLTRPLGRCGSVPVIGMRHHDNHAYWAYAVSPFAGGDAETMIVVLDGFGDDASMSLYVAREREIRLVRRVAPLFDSLGLLYSVISSTQGGWTTLSSEGRYMGAAAWGDRNRQTNTFYRKLRPILRLESDGEVRINRGMINYHKRGQDQPYAPPLTEILGPPIPQEQMWNPDAVLNVDDIAHPAITQERVDKAAALQMIFEDALFHIVEGMIRRTGSHQLILSGGTALNCIANMGLLDRFDESYYSTVSPRTGSRLHLWVPPNPSDTGTAMGAAYQFAMRHGAPLGPRMTHAFLCGAPPTTPAIRQALEAHSDVCHQALGNSRDPATLLRIAELIALVIANDGVMGLYQGAGETGPRALGHRSILANACNPRTRDVLNALVKYRERIRPLAPMLTKEEALRLFQLSEGASDDDFNAYNYMILTARAKPDAYRIIPAVIHKDGTSRLQIVRESTDPLSYAVLKALKPRLGVEVMVNTSLNVGTPIAQSPEQALEALKRSRGMSGMVMVGADGEAYLAWHTIMKPPKDAGQQLGKWVRQWQQGESLA